MKNKQSNLSHQLHLSSLVLSGLMLSAPLAQATEVELSTGLGVDSNPFRLNDSLQVNEDSYWRNRVKVKMEPTDDWYLVAKIDSHLYQDDSNADSLKLNIETGYEFDLSDDLELELSLVYASNDKVYVSRSKGTAFTYKSQDASDRYDYERWEPEVELEYKINKSNKIEFEIAHRLQSYQDLSHLGLEKLDYQQTTLELEWQHKFDKYWRITPYIFAKQRSYDERRDKAPTSSAIDDEQEQTTQPVVINYDYLGVGLKTSVKLSKSDKLFGKLAWTERSDNGSGYYDTQHLLTSITWHHKFANDGKLKMTAAYNDLDYSREAPLNDIENEAEAPSNKGWQLSLGYQQTVFEIADNDVDWYSKLVYFNYSADRVIYQYDRVKLETGLKVSF